MIKRSWYQWVFSPKLCTGWAILLLLSALLINQWNAIRQPNPIDFVTLSNRERTVPPVLITLPYRALSNPNYPFVLYTVSLNHNANGPTRWQIVVRNCIRAISVNNVPVNLASAEGNGCDTFSGIVIDLSPYLRQGINTIDVTVEASEGSYAFDIKPESSTQKPFFNAFVSAIFIVYSCCILWRQKVDWVSIVLYALTAVVSLHYLHISRNDTYTNDVGWHLGYIDYISQHWLRPYGYSTQQSSHPPLYYYVAGAVTMLNQMLIGLPYKTTLRFLSWIFFLIFNGFNVLTLRRMKFSGLGYYSCVALLLLWPGNAHLASKISSEPLYYALAAASFYYTMVWWQEGRHSDLMKSLLIAGVALLTRANAVILFPLIGILMLCALLRGQLSIRELFTRKWMMTGAALLLLVVLSMGNVIFYSGHTVLDGLASANKPVSFMHYFSMHYSFDQPFDKFNANQGFLEFLLKTSMFGEYKWSSPQWAVPMDYLVVAIFFYSLFPWLIATRERWRGMLPYVIYLASSVLFAVYFSLLITDGASQDVRYIYPALICFVVFFGKSYAYYQQRGVFLLTWLGSCLAIAFTCLSTYFFWNNFR